MFPEPLDTSRIARLEETRQAIGTADLADASEPIAGGIMSFAGVGSWANQASGLGLRGPVPDEELDRLVAFYSSRGVEPRVELCGTADESLTKGLAARNFTVREFENVLVRQAGGDDALTAARERAREAGIELTRLDPADTALVERFIDVSTVGFRPEGEPVPEPLARLVRRMAKHKRSVCHLAWVEGEPVGGSGMEVSELIEGERVACLFGTSVVPGYRRRGVQQALIAERVRVAHEAGASFVCIHSKPGIATERNAARLGFHLAYTKAILAMAGEGLVPSP